MTVSALGPVGLNEWYTGDVSVGLAAGGAAIEYSLDGSPFTRYTERFTVTSDGVHTLAFRTSTGKQGEFAFAIDATKPTIQLLVPAENGTYKLGSPLTADYRCEDTGSGLVDCVGTFPAGAAFDVTQPSNGTFTVTARDRAGNVADPPVHPYRIFADEPPTDPGAPFLFTGSTPNRGEFSLAWPASTDSHGDPFTYSLQHRDADDLDFSDVAAGLTEALRPFAGAQAEAEGTWVYRAAATDGGLTSGYSNESAPVKVDRSAPNAPTLAADRAPEDAVGGWFRDSATVLTTSNGDAVLADGSAGSGIASVTDPITKSESGVFAIEGTATDNVGLTSSSTLTLKVDATAPTLSLECPTAPAYLGKPTTIPWTASDAHSGLAGAASGTAALNTTTLGQRVVQYTVADNVGNRTSATCTYTVVYRFLGFFMPVRNLPVLNTAFAGLRVPVKFTLDGAFGNAVFQPGYPRSVPIPCASAAPVGEIPALDPADPGVIQFDPRKRVALELGNGTILFALPGSLPAEARLWGLQLPPGVALYEFTGQYTYWWRPSSAWRGTCRQLVVALLDGRVQRANFRFR